MHEAHFSVGIGDGHLIVHGWFGAQFADSVTGTERYVVLCPVLEYPQT